MLWKRTFSNASNEIAKTYAFPVSLGLSTAEPGMMLFFVINAILCLWMARLKDDRHEMKISGR